MSAVDGPAAPGALVGRDAERVRLDTCEHVIDAAAAVAAELLGAGPHVRVLATSREPLHLPGERVLSLRPLPVPADAAERGAADSPAVVLFTQRAQRARDGFSLDEATLPAVVEICRALDGLPLALEIAGARVRSLGVADIAARLGQRSWSRSSTAREPRGRPRRRHGAGRRPPTRRRRRTGRPR